MRRTCPITRTNTPEGVRWCVQLPSGEVRMYRAYEVAYTTLRRAEARQQGQQTHTLPTWATTPTDDAELAYLRELVLADGRPQRVIAQEWFGVRQGTLSSWLTGEKSLPSGRRHLLRRVAQQQKKSAGAH